MNSKGRWGAEWGDRVNGRGGRGRSILAAVGLVALGNGAQAAPFQVVEANAAQHWVSEQQREPLVAGQTASAPWRAVTAEGGRLLLVGAGMRLEFTGRCDAALAAASRPLDARQIHTFLKPGTEGAALRASDSVFDLREGTLLAEVGERPLSLSCPHLLADGRNSVFAVSSHPQQGALLTVLKGQVKVQTPERTVIFVSKGKSLRVASGIPPQLGLLEENPEGQEHKRGLLLLSSAENKGVARGSEEVPQAVGGGAETPFDLSRRRRAALLTAPSPEQIGQPEVSPELPQTPSINP